MIEMGEFEGVAASIRQARRFVADHLAGVDVDTVEEVTLMVSELATNCVRHAVTPFTVSMERSSGHLRIEVVDRGTGRRPELRSPSPAEPSGRGLRIVAELSDEWGIASSPDDGSAVWFSVRLGRDRDLMTRGA